MPDLRLKTTALALLASGAMLSSAQADAPNVVASIKPIHSLVASVMEGVGEPDLLVGGAASPHTYVLKPSEAQILQNANVVFWVGEGMENFLEKPLETIAKSATAVELLATPGITVLEPRGDHEDHTGHDDHGKAKKAKADDHDHDHDHDHGRAKKVEADDHDHEHGGEKHADAGHDHDHDHAHDHGDKDAHIWLDPQNAVAMLDHIEKTLSKADPDNAETYRKNAESAKARAAALSSSLAKQLEPVRQAKFLVFHDAYQYFENRFGMTRPDAATLNPEVTPGAARLKELQEMVSEENITCAFAEPQFPAKLLDVVRASTTMKTAIIDPLGSTIDAGPDHYFATLEALATSFTNCLKTG